MDLMSYNGSHEDPNLRIQDTSFFNQHGITRSVDSKSNYKDQSNNLKTHDHVVQSQDSSCHVVAKI